MGADRVIKVKRRWKENRKGRCRREGKGAEPTVKCMRCVQKGILVRHGMGKGWGRSLR